MSNPQVDSGIVELIRETNAAFTAGDASRWAACFADDGRNLLLNREALVGRAAILEFWEAAFARVDTSAWDPRIDTVEQHGDHAWAFTTYTERLRNREDGSRTLVRGRLVYILRRDDATGWRIRLLMNSHSHPMEPIP